MMPLRGSDGFSGRRTKAQPLRDGRGRQSGGQRFGNAVIDGNTKTDDAGEDAQVGAEGTEDQDEKHDFCDEEDVQKSIQLLQVWRTVTIVAIKNLERSRKEPDKTDDAPDAKGNNQ